MIAASKRFRRERAYSKEPVHVTRLLLPAAPHARERLGVDGRIPVRVEEDESVGADQVDATAAGLRGKQEGEDGRIGVERVDPLLPLVGGERAVEPHEAIPAVD